MSRNPRSSTVIFGGTARYRSAIVHAFVSSPLHGHSSLSTKYEGGEGVGILSILSYSFNFVSFLSGLKNERTYESSIESKIKLQRCSPE